MSRHRKIEKRELQPDIIYNDKVVARFIGKMVKQGKKTLAEGIFHKAMAIVSDKTKKDPLEVFKKAIKNVKPALEVKSRRVGGATYQVPIEVGSDRGQNLAIGWILTNSTARKGKPFEEKLAQELMDAFNGTGASIKKRDDTHKMAEANKAFSHFRW